MVPFSFWANLNLMLNIMSKIHTHPQQEIFNQNFWLACLFTIQSVVGVHRCWPVHSISSQNRQSFSCGATWLLTDEEDLQHFHVAAVCPHSTKEKCHLGKDARLNMFLLPNKCFASKGMGWTLTIFVEHSGASIQFKSKHVPGATLITAVWEWFSHNTSRARRSRVLGRGLAALHEQEVCSLDFALHVKSALFLSHKYASGLVLDPFPVDVQKSILDPLCCSSRRTQGHSAGQNPGIAGNAPHTRSLAQRGRTLAKLDERSQNCPLVQCSGMSLQNWMSARKFCDLERDRFGRHFCRTSQNTAVEFCSEMTIQPKTNSVLWRGVGPTSLFARTVPQRLKTGFLTFDRSRNDSTWSLPGWQKMIYPWGNWIRGCTHTTWEALDSGVHGSTAECWDVWEKSLWLWVWWFPKATRGDERSPTLWVVYPAGTAHRISETSTASFGHHGDARTWTRRNVSVGMEISVELSKSRKFCLLRQFTSGKLNKPTARGNRLRWRERKCTSQLLFLECTFNSSLFWQQNVFHDQEGKLQEKTSFGWVSKSAWGALGKRFNFALCYFALGSPTEVRSSLSFLKMIRRFNIPRALVAKKTANPKANVPNRQDENKAVKEMGRNIRS